MTEDSIYRGWDIWGRAEDRLKRAVLKLGLSRETRQVVELLDSVERKLRQADVADTDGCRALAAELASRVLLHHRPEHADVTSAPIFRPLAGCFFQLIEAEGYFAAPQVPGEDGAPKRSDLWAIEDQLRRTAKILDHFDDVQEQLCLLVDTVLTPIIEQQPSLVLPYDDETGTLSFPTALAENLIDAPEIVETMVQVPFAPELETYALTTALRERLEYNLVVSSGGNPADPKSFSKTARMPTRAWDMSTKELIKTYLGGTPFTALFDCTVPVTIPQATRFEHHHIVAGSGHGKTQTLQQLILHDLEAVSAGNASIVVIDSQSDLINTIAGMQVFAPGELLADRLCLIDPTDVEWPVALNLFDVGLERINQYSQLDRERLTNSILELYDFVLGSLLDAGMTQKQSVIFRYITRLMLHIPNATIHTFRELLEDGGYETYQEHIEKLQGSARAFFDNEFRGNEFTNTRRQVLRRLYGILENQTFERMFSHPKSKLDLFSELNAGKVILINTAKDLLKENGAEIFGRFFIAMIAQAAQERAVLPNSERLPTFVYIDEANDYFDRTIGVILSQARKYNIGLIAAHQYLGQLETKLQEAMSANTSIKFAGGVSAKDARSWAAELRTQPEFIENQDKLSFAAFIKGTTRHAVSIAIEPGRMEAMPRMSADEKEAQREAMRAQYAVHYSEINGGGSAAGEEEPKAEKAEPEKPDTDDGPEDDGEPMVWE